MYQTILAFWFEEIDQAKWWKKDPDFDKTVIERFSSIHLAAKTCELYQWRASAQGRLAEIIILDQFSRNMFRESPLAFANDAMALALAQEAIGCGADQQLGAVERAFLYMPFMHSESLKIHEQAVDLFEKIGIDSYLDFEIKHKNIIQQFARYPHRNVILGRQSSNDELAFLMKPGSAF